MINYTAMRAKLVQKIESSKRVQSDILAVDTPSHVHSLKTYKQTVQPDTIEFQGQAYFIVVACELECGYKRITGYKVEN